MSSVKTMKPFPNKFTGCTVLLIAGTGGIGMGIANLLLTRGAAKVILTSTRQAKLDNCISTLHATHPSLSRDAVSGYTLDLASSQVEDNIKATFAAIQKDGVNTIHHLIYLAGDPLPMINLEDVTLEKWQQSSQVRTISTLLAIKHARPFLENAAKDKSANPYCSPSITITSGSIASKPIAGGWSLLAMMAGGLVALARQLAFDFAPEIRVNCVSPGVVDTELWSGMDEQTRTGFYESHAKSVPIGRVATVEDVAESFAYAICDGNVTGVEIRTDSGIVLV